MKPNEDKKRSGRPERAAGMRGAGPDLNAAIIATMAGLVVVLDREGRIVRFNRACERMTGYAFAEVKDKVIWDIFLIPEEVESVKAVFARLKAGRFPNEHENYWLTKEGERRLIAWSNSAVLGEGGEVEYVIGTGIDISEQRRVESELRESEERFRTMVDSIPQLAWIARADGFVYWYNRRWYEYTGTTPEQIESGGWQSVHDPRMLPSVLERWRASIASGEPFDMEFPLRGADGRFRWFLTRGMPLKDEQGRVVHWFGTNTDVSEKREAVEALRASEGRLRRLYDSGLIGILHYDLDGSITDANDRFLEMVGYTREDLRAGRLNWAQLTPPEYRALDEHAIAELKATGVDTPYEKEYLRKDGSRLPILIGAATYDEAHQRSIAFVLDISERARAEQALEAARAEAVNEKNRLEAVLEALPVGVAILDARGGVLRTNATYDHIWGGPRPATRSVADYAPYRAWWVDTGEAVRPEEWASAQAVQKGETVLGQLVRIQRFDGSRAYVLNGGVPIRDQKGKITGSVVAIMDVSERVEAERALRESEERTRLILANSPDIVFLQDRDLRYTWIINPPSPLRPEDVIGKTDYDLLTMEEARALTTIKRRVMETGIGTREELPLAPGGVGRWYDAAYEPLRNSRGEIVGVAAYARDITERKWAEEERERALAELDAAFASLSDPIFVYDTSANLVRCNPAARATLGHAPAGATLAQIVEKSRLRHLNGRAIVADEMPAARALRGEAVSGEHLVYTDAAGRDRHALATAAPMVMDGRIAGAVAVWHDITELMEYDRLKDQFLIVAAHELKTPVAIMKGYAQALLRGVEEASPRRRRMLEAIDRGANRIESVVNDLLDISRLLADGLELAYERVDLSEMVEEVADRIALISPKHEIKVLKVAPVAVYGDRDRLEQVLANLVDNAIRYSPGGGDIDVAVEARGSDAVVSVRDHGVGIPEDRQGRIFQRFYRAHTRTPYDYGGMGVGLYISKEIVERHGGRMWFTSEEGEGSTFSFSLPLGGGRGSR